MPPGWNSSDRWRKVRFTRLWIVAIWAALGVARLAVLVLPFRHLGGFLGSDQGVAPWVPVASPGERERALWIGGMIIRASRWTPWISNCFPQALVASLMLRLFAVPHAVFFGLARKPDGTGMEAHAWVASDRVAVTGGAGFFTFTVVGMFLPRFLMVKAGPPPAENRRPHG